MFNIHMLPASFGDSLLIEYGPREDPKYILIDGGPYYQFDEILSVLKKKVPDIKEIELVVVTHIDIDHIDGIIRLINHDPPLYKINHVWFNNYDDLSYDIPDDLLGGIQGEYLGVLLKMKGLNKNKKPITIHRTKSELKIEGGMEITVINPTQNSLGNLVKEWDKHLEKANISHDENEVWAMLNGDKRYASLPTDLLGDDDDSIEALAKKECDEDESPANKSSIAFIATYNNLTCLFSGDATSEDLKENLISLDFLDEFNNLYVDAWKLSHHGSKKSTQDYLMQTIQSKKILISSDGKRYHHPDKETIAKLLVHQEQKLDIYFNYTSKYNKDFGDLDVRNEYKTNFHYPDEEGYMYVGLEEE